MARLAEMTVGAGHVRMRRIATTLIVAGMMLGLPMGLPVKLDGGIPLGAAVAQDVGQVARGLEAGPQIVFGPSPRAHDNREIFSDAYLPEWTLLRQAGVPSIVLNPTFVMMTEFDGGWQTLGDADMPRRRPNDTYLKDSDLRRLADIADQTGLEVIYEAGAALGHDLCASGAAPALIGEVAARREFSDAIQRLHDAGISVSTLNVDGPFLRLVSQSRKAGACALESGDGLSIEDAVTAARSYMIVLRDLVEDGNPRRLPRSGVRVNLIVNLPNWQVLNLPRTGNPDGPPTVDLREVMAAFTRTQRENLRAGNRLEIDEIVVDYPWAMIDEGREWFRDRTRHLWNMTRDVNPNGVPPSIGFIVNTLSYTVDCPEAGPNRVPFLPYRRDGESIPQSCLTAQMGLQDDDPDRRDTDRDFISESVRYARALQPGGELDQILMTADGTRIVDHIGHLYFQSWGVNPTFNSWYMGEVIDYMEERP